MSENKGYPHYNWIQARIEELTKEHMTLEELGREMEKLNPLTGKAELELMEEYIGVCDEMIAFARENNIQLPLFKQQFTIGDIEYILVTDDREKMFSMIKEIIELYPMDAFYNINYRYELHFTHI